MTVYIQQYSVKLGKFVMVPRAGQVGVSRGPGKKRGSSYTTGPTKVKSKPRGSK